MRMPRFTTELKLKSFYIKKVALSKVIFLAIISYLVYFLILILAKGI